MYFVYFITRYYPGFSYPFPGPLRLTRAPWARLYELTERVGCEEGAKDEDKGKKKRMSENSGEIKENDAKEEKDG